MNVVGFVIALSFVTAENASALQPAIPVSSIIHSGCPKVGHEAYVAEVEFIVNRCLQPL